MNHSAAIIRSLVIYGVCLPLAIYLGFVLATPENRDSVIVVGLVLGALLLPVLLVWHHPFLVWGWNTAFVMFFLPGSPPAWLALAAAGFGAAVLKRALNRGEKFLAAWPVLVPLAALLAVVMVTAKLTGGLNLRAAGSAVYGGKRYLFVLGSVLGYLALTSRRIPLEKARRYAVMFFLGALTSLIALLVMVVPGGFYWIFLLVPPDSYGMQAMMGNGLVPGAEMVRLGGLAGAGMAVFCGVLVAFGLRGLLTMRRVGWLVVLVVGAGATLFGGFRSTTIMIGMIFVVMYWLEGLVRTRWTAGLCGLLVLGAVVLVPFANRLPLAMQRSLSFLPLELNTVVTADAEGSSEWRLMMWKKSWPEAWEHLWLGKGYAINSRDLDFAVSNPQLVREGYEIAQIAGDYHSGPLSVLIPFGLPGLVTFLWLLGGCVFVLVRNHRYGDAGLKTINTFLLATFLVRSVFFFAVFGSFFSDLNVFLSLVGLSVSLNGGVARRTPTAPVTEPPRLRFRVRENAH